MLLFTNWIPPNFLWQKEGYFQKYWFFLILMIVSTSESKSCKILFCLGEVVVISIIVFFLPVVTIEVMGSQFLQKNFIAPCRICFSGYWKTVISFIRYSRQWKCLPRETFSTNSSFRLVETNYLSSRNYCFIQSSVEVFKI